MIAAAKIEFVTRNCRGRQDLSHGVKLPLDAGEVGNTGGSIGAGVLRITAKHGVLRKQGGSKRKNGKQEKPFHEQSLRSPHRRPDPGNLSCANAHRLREMPASADQPPLPSKIVLLQSLALLHR